MSSMSHGDVNATNSNYVEQLVIEFGKLLKSKTTIQDYSNNYASN